MPRTKNPNAYRIVGDAAIITLTQGQEATIDKDDLDLVLQYRWRAHRVKTAHGDVFYVWTRIPKGPEMALHRLIMHPRKGRVVDHKDFNPLNNRRSNLRSVTPSQNKVHRFQPAVNTTTGITGVTVMTRKNRDKGYQVVISRDGIKKRRFFPYTPEGLEEAQALSMRWQRDIHYKPDRTPRPHAPKRVPPPLRAKSGHRGVGTTRVGPITYWNFRCGSKFCPALKRFPYTDEGFQAAVRASEEHHAPKRTTDEQ